MNRIRHGCFAMLLLCLCGGIPLATTLATESSGKSPGEPFGTVTWVEGRVTERDARGRETAIAQGSAVSIGRTIRVARGARAEITYRDGSVVRLAPGTRYRIKAAEFSGKLRKRLSANLSAGRLWSRVTSGRGARRGSFNITTPNAVLGVRGTTWDLKAAADDSTEVSVYEGRVGVSPPTVGAGEAHEEIAWPVEVSEAEWEEIIVGQLQRLRIGADGKPGAPVPFAPGEEQDPWVEWNLARDAVLAAGGGN